jgi:hypothetical protein
MSDRLTLYGLLEDNVMDQNSTVVEQQVVREDQNVRFLKPNRFKNYLWAVPLALIVFAVLWAYVAFTLDDISAQERLDELKSRSPAHEQILTGYYRCRAPLHNPGQLACIGAVSKGAELLGIKASVVDAVLVDAGIIDAQKVKVAPAPAQPPA